MKIIVCLLMVFPSCMVFSNDPPKEPPPLQDMETPLELFEEPADEAARSRLSPGSFSGIYVGDAKASLDDLLGNSKGLTVTKVVENSPGDFAGIMKGDVLLKAWTQESDTIELAWPSQWRKIELENRSGQRIHLVYDRAEMEKETSLVLTQRATHPKRIETERFEETQKVGIVLRTATEKEARAAGLGPGGGAVLVGLSKTSPWRGKGLRFEDLIVEINHKAVDHPHVVLDAILDAEDDALLTLKANRGGSLIDLTAPITNRESEVTKVYIPLLFSYEKERGQSETSCLFGLYNYKSTKVAWKLRLLWLFQFKGGDSDRLEEVSP